MEKNITFKSLIPWIVLCLVLGIFPYLVASLATPEGQVFNGTLTNYDDLSAYLSAIRQGAEGEWLYHFNFSPEPLPPRLTYLFYLALGRLSALLGGPHLFWFHLARLLSGLLALYFFLYWVQEVFPAQVHLQKTAWLLLAFGSGVGWVLVLFLPTDSPILADFLTPEWNTVTTLLSPTHFILANGFLAFFFAALSQVRSAPRSWSPAVLAALAGLGISLVYPFHIGTLGLILGLYMLAIAVQSKEIPWPIWIKAGLVTLTLIPFLYYYLVSSRSNPLWATIYIQDHNIPSPPILGVFAGFGLVLLLGVVGLVAWVRRKNDPLLPIWAVVHLCTVYLPVPFSGRYVLGLHLPIATLAAYGLEAVVLPWMKSRPFYAALAKLSPTPYQTARRLFIILTVPTTIMFTLNLVKSALTHPNYPYYYPASEVQAMQWLAARTTEDDLIFAYYTAGNYLPRVTAAKVFAGQLFMTVHLDEKLALAETFWDPRTSPSWRQDFIQTWGIDYVYQGQIENLLSAGEVTPPGEIVYQQDGVTIYRLP